jgi:hypothetical protein
MKTYSTKDLSERLGKSPRRIKQILQFMSDERKTELGIYKNSSGYQVPVENYKKILIK